MNIKIEFDRFYNNFYLVFTGSYKIHLERTWNWIFFFYDIKLIIRDTIKYKFYIDVM